MSDPTSGRGVIGLKGELDNGNLSTPDIPDTTVKMEGSDIPIRAAASKSSEGGSCGSQKKQSGGHAQGKYELVSAEIMRRYNTKEAYRFNIKKARRFGFAFPTFGGESKKHIWIPAGLVSNDAYPVRIVSANLDDKGQLRYKPLAYTGAWIRFKISDEHTEVWDKAALLTWSNACKMIDFSEALTGFEEQATVTESEMKEVVLLWQEWHRGTD